MRYLLIILLSLLMTGCSLNPCSLFDGPDFGSFSGPVQTAWIDPEGRKMMVLETVTYEDPFGVEWEAPAGWLIDGSSIPRIFWTLVASPYVGNHRQASVFHDVACDMKSASWEDVHRMYYYACRLGGVGEAEAKLLFAAVWIGGPRWEYPIDLSDIGLRGPPVLMEGKYPVWLIESHEKEIRAIQKAKLIIVQQAIEENEEISLDEIILLAE